MKNEKYFNGREIYNFILSGADRIIKNEKYLNDINVFPVKDGDTGTNLSFTMNHIISNSSSYESVSLTLKSISEAAIEGSYGNSGAIFSNYIHGLYVSLANKDEITSGELITGLNSAVRNAYNSIADPVEGTILTVMKKWGEYLLRENINYPSLEKLMGKSLDYAYSVLDSTKNMLTVLKNADVVDSGAKGFVCFIEGIHSYIKDGKTEHKNLSRKEVIDINRIKSIHEEASYKYCTEMTVKDFAKDSDYIRKLFRGKGDSLVITRHEDSIKIHIHTDEPAVIAREMSQTGKITYNKIDDMKIRQDIIENKKYSIGLITDSIADLPQKYIEEKQIIVIPLNFFCNESIYLDKYTINCDTVFDIIDKTREYPKSSQPNERYIDNIFKFMTEHFDYIMGIFISDKMSKTYEKIQKISQRYITEYKHIKIVNSKSNSACEGLLVKEAAELISAGKDFGYISEYIEKKKELLRTFVKVPSLEYAAKSGRVPKAANSIFSLIGFQPVVSIDREGNGAVLKKSNIIKLLKKYLKDNKIKRYAIVHTGDKKEISGFVKDIENIVGFSPDYIEKVSAIVAAFMGKGCYGICILGDENNV